MPLQVYYETAVKDSRKWDSSRQQRLTVPLQQCNAVSSYCLPAALCSIHLPGVLCSLSDVSDRNSNSNLLKSSQFEAFLHRREHANQVKRRKQCLLEQIQSHRFQDWDRDQDPETHCYDAEWPSHLPFFSPDLDSRNHKPTGQQTIKRLTSCGLRLIVHTTGLKEIMASFFLLSGLGSIPESDLPERSMPCQHHLPPRAADFRQVQPGSALADALGEFLLPPDPPGLENLYEEDGTSLHDASMLDRCSSASSDSSIDIAFVKCPKAPPASHHGIATNVSTARDVFGNGGGGGQRNGYSKLPNRGCVSPDEAILMRRNQHRPLQASQRKSKVSLFARRHM